LEQEVQGEIWKAMHPQMIKYMCYQYERGESGTLHVQGMVLWTQSISTQNAKRRIGQNAHVEIARDVEASRGYCMKEDTRVHGPYEIGEYERHQGKSKALVEIEKMVKNGKPDSEIAEKYFQEYVRHHRGIAAARLALTTSQTAYTPKRVFLFWGPPGKGKTYFVTKTLNLTCLYVKDPTNKWWDGYEGQENVMVDEFPGTLSALDWKRILGELNITLETKGGTVRNKVKNIFLTSNYSLDGMFEKAKQVDRDAIYRRIEGTYFIENHVTSFNPFLDVWLQTTCLPPTVPQALPNQEICTL